MATYRDRSIYADLVLVLDRDRDRYRYHPLLFLSCEVAARGDDRANPSTYIPIYTYIGGIRV